MKPTKFKAQDLQGEWVVGWYAIHHMAVTDRHDKLIGYKEVPMLFNDEQGERSKGSYWHTINPDTLQEAKEETQLKLFDL